MYRALVRYALDDSDRVKRKAMAAEGRKTKAPAMGDEGDFYETVRRFWQKSYAGDYIGLAVLVSGYILLKLFDEPFHQQFHLDDPRIQHPHAEIERVSPTLLFGLAGVAPAIVLLALSLVWRSDIRKIHTVLLGLAISLAMTLFLTDLFKDAIGRPRPDLIARCNPIPETPRDQMVTIAVCQETRHHVLHDGWRSYPSGHSSFAFAGLGWLALYLTSHYHALKPRASLAAVLLCLTPLIAAAMIAISRLEDYRHDVGDVVTGSTLGFAITYFNWRRYWPSLLAKQCDEPHASPSSNGRTSPGGSFHRVRDEEEGYTGDDERYNMTEL